MKIICLLYGIACCFASSKYMHQRDIVVQVMGNSGKMTMSRGNNSLVVKFDYIKELDKDNVTVGSSNHSISSFASQWFDFYSSGFEEGIKYQNISVLHIDYRAILSGPGAKLVVNAYLFDGTGTVSTSENEKLEVRPGTLKFNIGIEDWKFCGGSASCKKGNTTETGTQIELGIEIKGRKIASKKSKKRGKGERLQTLDLGNADCTLSGEVNIDGMWKDMVSPFPKVDVKGAKQLFIFRFPKFNTKAFYDPTIELSNGSTPTQSPTQGPNQGSTSKPNSASKCNAGFLIVIMIFIVFAKMLM